MLQIGFLFPHRFIVHHLPAAAQNLHGQAVFSHLYLLILDVMHKHLLILDMIHQSEQLRPQVLFMITSCAPFVLAIQRTWPSVADIRHAVNVEKTSNHAPFVGPRYRRESGFIRQFAPRFFIWFGYSLLADSNAEVPSRDKRGCQKLIGHEFMAHRQKDVVARNLMLKLM
ncbi:hypothetical protein CUMW_020580 [Citrus unshiu]|nr:hypothetical protein CUMW_020580 [Citrus unshiu]GAY36201.1 hypothetical protein CUMW_020580 [Citrus unshiu]GAY36202.1 hypothetical protein CUMW_020580 [Citrus unshiu]